MELTKAQENQIIAAVKEAGRYILTAHDIRRGIIAKPGDDNFVTEYDIGAQRMLMKRLSDVVSGARFLAEEADVSADTSADNTADNTNNGAIFIIDPIDGTTNFIYGYRKSAISVAYVFGGTVVFGCVYDPYLDELFYARRGVGAFLLAGDANPYPIHVSERPLYDSLVSFGTSPYEKHLAEPTFHLAEALFHRSRDVRRSGSAALDICYVAAGRCGLFFEFSLSTWDFAAAALILTEAGGKITAIDGKQLPSSDGRKSSVLAGGERALADFASAGLADIIKDTFSDSCIN